MKALCISLALLLSATCAAAAQEVLFLPEDGGLWHTTLIFPHDTAADQTSRRLSEHFAASPRLQKLASQTSLHRYTPSDPLFATRYAPYFGGVFPALLIQKADGTVVYKVSGDAIPKDSEALANEIAQAVDQCCPLRPKPQPKPGPQPNPQPGPSPSPQQTVRPQVPLIDIELIPDIRPVNEEPQSEPTKAPPLSPLSPILLLAPIVAGALGLRRAPRSL
jgi:hypothetical protein